MGDALATGIMAHICRKDFVKEGEQVRESKNPSMNRFGPEGTKQSLCVSSPQGCHDPFPSIFSLV